MRSSSPSAPSPGRKLALALAFSQSTDQAEEISGRRLRHISEFALRTFADFGCC